MGEGVAVVELRTTVGATTPEMVVTGAGETTMSPASICGPATLVTALATPDAVVDPSMTVGSTVDVIADTA